jgi:hypothetical protein
LDDPNEAMFYASGRTSNEAAFLYQLMVRSFGTNNLPDCSNMCHESSGAALAETTGIGKGTVSLADIHRADLIVVVGQNPGTNHPRMLSALEEAKAKGAKVIAVDPLPEAGLMRFKNPQTVRGVVGKGTPPADEFAQIRLGGDLAFFQALGTCCCNGRKRPPARSSTRHSSKPPRTDSRTTRSRSATSTGTRSEKQPDSPANRSSTSHACSSNPSARSTAGRWA